MELFLYNSRFAIDIGEVRLGACVAFTVSGEASGSGGGPADRGGLMRLVSIRNIILFFLKKTRPSDLTCHDHRR